MEQLIVISAVGGDRTGVVHDLTQIIMDCGGSIKDSRMTTLGEEFAMLLLVSGNWHSVSRMEQDLTRFADDKGLVIQLKRTQPKQPDKPTNQQTCQTPDNQTRQTTKPTREPNPDNQPKPPNKPTSNKKN